MLGSDLVRARRRADKLLLQKLKGADEEIAREIASSILSSLESHVGDSWDEVVEAIDALPRDARLEKLFMGIKKLALDDCDFGMPLSVDAPALRKDIFELACVRRLELKSGEKFERSEVLEEIAKRYEVESTVLADALFGDLKGAQRLNRASSFDASALVERYEIAQVQGVLLKAVRLVAVVNCKSPDAYRRLFHKLKFRQLLYRLTQLEDGAYQIEIEGPFSLFESVTKYGLQLAMIVPALLECDKTELTAEVRWGKERKPLSFSTVFKKARDEISRSDLAEKDGHVENEPPLRSELSALLKALKKKKSEWVATPNDELLDIPGVGLCVPDLKFKKKGGQPVYFELLGFWSREAVWKRIEWAQAQSKRRVLFAVSTRLRVSQDVLDETSSSALYVFKGAMSAATVLAQLDSLSSK